MTHPAQIVTAALAATTATDATNVQQMIGAAFGATHKRPVGDKWNNHGLMSTSGSFDYKLIENVTNMQDAVIERHALRKYGGADAIPYLSPQVAAADLFPFSTVAERARMVTVTFQESDRPTGTTKRLTPIFRDQGCGLRPESVPTTIFGLGGSQKDGALYQQGAFGLGGAMTFRNAAAVVLVSRRDPKLLAAGEQDLITVAVVQWQDNVKGRTAYYLVDQKWNTAGDPGQPWSCPAAEVPDFEPGTHLALVSYRVDGFHRVREGDERTFDTVTNTRLFRPVLPIRFTNMIARGEKRSTNLVGLEYRLDNAKQTFDEGEDTLPFSFEGTTYTLPVRYVLFAKKPGDAGGRRSFVAHNHAVLFLSNGQTHHHWTPQQFKLKTKLNKLHDRILVVVDTDELPIRVRTGLFTADRSELVRGDAALRLEEDLRAFLNDWEALKEENNAAIREALTGGDAEPTLEAARKISRAMNIPGFGSSGDSGSGGGGTKRGGAGQGGGGGKPSKPIDLKNDPTTITGPNAVQAVIGRTRSITYTVDVVDEFFNGRGQLAVDSDHPNIRGGHDITVGKGNKGRVRVSVAVSDTLEPGTYELRLRLADWMKSSGGIGHTLEHTTKIELVEEIPGQGNGSGSGKPTHGTGTASGPSQGTNIALVWRGLPDQDSWTRTTVGEIIDTPAYVLAESNADYKDLAVLGEQNIPTVLLNADFTPLKQYLTGRNKQLDSLTSPKERYSVGVGVGLLLLKASADQQAATDPITDKVLAAAQNAIAKGVLAVMPAFDDLTKAAGLDDNEADADG